MESGLDLLGKSFGVLATGARLDLEVQFRESALMEDVHAMFDDVRERGQSVMDRGRVHVDPADDDHVVGAPEDAATEKPVSEGAHARTRSPVR